MVLKAVTADMLSPSSSRPPPSNVHWASAETSSALQFDQQSTDQWFDQFWYLQVGKMVLDAEMCFDEKCRQGADYQSQDNVENKFPVVLHHIHRCRDLRVISE